MLLKAVDDRLRLTNQLAHCLVDRRDPEKIQHSVRDLLRQRIFGLACGYADGNDATRLADDPLHKLAVGRDPVIAHHQERLQGRVQRITIDLDQIDDPTYGQQALASFNGHYDTWCYLPLVATLTFGVHVMMS